MALDAIRAPLRYDQIFYASGNPCMQRFSDKTLVYFDQHAGDRNGLLGIIKSSDGTGYLNFNSSTGNPRLIITTSEVRIYKGNGNIQRVQAFESHGKPIAFSALQLKISAGLQITIAGKRNILAKIAGMQEPVFLAQPQVQNHRSGDRAAARALEARAMQRSAGLSSDALSMRGSTRMELAPHIIVDRSADDPGFRPMFAPPLPRYTTKERRRARQLRLERRDVLTSHGALDSTTKRLQRTHEQGWALDRPSASGRELGDVAAGLIALATPQSTAPGSSNLRLSNAPAADRGQSLQVQATQGRQGTRQGTGPVHDKAILGALALAHIGERVSSGSGGSRGNLGTSQSAMRPQSFRESNRRAKWTGGDSDATRRSVIAGVITDMEGVMDRLSSSALQSGITKRTTAAAGSTGAAALSDMKLQRHRTHTDRCRIVAAAAHCSLSCGAHVKSKRAPRPLRLVEPSDLLDASKSLASGRLLVAVLDAVAPGCPQALKAAAQVEQAVEECLYRKARSRSAREKGPRAGRKAHFAAVGTPRTMTRATASASATGSVALRGVNDSPVPSPRPVSLIHGITTKLHGSRNAKSESKKDDRGPRLPGNSRSQSWAQQIPRESFTASTGSQTMGKRSLGLQNLEDLQRPGRSELKDAVEGGLKLKVLNASGGGTDNSSVGESPFEFVRCRVSSDAGRQLLARLGFRSAPVLVIARGGNTVFSGNRCAGNREVTDAAAIALQCFECL